MLIEKVLNNNVVITRDERNQEMIVMEKVWHSKESG